MSGARRHEIEEITSRSISAVMSQTGETPRDIADLLGIDAQVVRHRLRCVTPWRLAEIGIVADHWDVPPCSMISGPEDTLAELPSERVAELRAAKGLPVFESVLA